MLAQRSRERAQEPRWEDISTDISTDISSDVSGDFSQVRLQMKRDGGSDNFLNCEPNVGGSTLRGAFQTEQSQLRFFRVELFQVGP